MYTASAAFHRAIQDGAPQRALLIFDDAFFTNEDINVEQGIEFNDTFNEETDLAIGQALSNHIRFTLYNDNGLLNSYDFGKFTATIGARVSESTYKQRAYVTVVKGSNIYLGNNRNYPYLTRNGTAMNVTFPVHGVFVLDDTVHVFGTVGYYAAFSDSTGAKKTISTNSFMMHKASRLDAVGMYYNSATRTMKEYLGGVIGTYEFVPLGVFTAVRPNVGTVIEIDFDCNDQMQLFDRDMPEDLNVSYPATLGELINAMCEYVGVPNGAGTFLNSDETITEEPEELKKATMRRAVGWIAEAACSNARFDRDGIFRLEWVRPTNQTLTEHDYIEFNPYWYAVPKIDKLYNRDTSESLENYYGDGTNGYLIQDNPFMALVKKDFDVISNYSISQTVTAGEGITLSVTAKAASLRYQDEIRYMWQQKDLESCEWYDTGVSGSSFGYTTTEDDTFLRFRCKISIGDNVKYSRGITIIVEPPEEDEETGGEGEANE